jgi:predicted nucleotidyltransferase
MERDRILAELEHSARRLLLERPDVRRVVLFGSYARGDAGLWSDADVLLVLSSSPHGRWFDRIPEFLEYFLDMSVPVDIFPYTEEEVERMDGRGNPLIRTALEGLVVAEA